MADSKIDATGDLEGAWRRSLATAIALIATLVLIALMAAVSFANRDRDVALALERHSQNVVLLTRVVDATIARSEAALGRFVLDESRDSGMTYYNEWRLASRQVDQLRQVVRDPEQRARVAELRALYRKRGEEFAIAASLASQREGRGGIDYFYQATLAPTGQAVRDKLAEIATSSRESLDRRIAETVTFGEEAEALTEWLGWLAVLIGIGAILIGVTAFRALIDREIAQEEAENESHRAQALEEAVARRTAQLREANERLHEEAVELAATQAQLLQVRKLEAVGQLTGGIAHDFNNMLAVVIGGLDLARRKLGASESEVKAHIDNAMEGANRAAALTRRLLAFARSEGLSPEAIEPRRLIDGMLEMIDRSIGERIVVETRYDAAGWSVWADPGLLENALLNLCVNARDAMDGEGRIVIAVENVELAAGAIGSLAGGEYVRIAVSDAGTGISPENMEKIFEPFFTTKPIGKGTGLGLSQIFGFARQSDGDVTVSSREGEGTTVAIYLPRSAKAAATGAASTQRDAPLPMAPAGATVLVVEDDPRVARATVGALEDLGYRTIACESGADALQALERGAAVSLVLSDVLMPGMTGPELLRSIAGLYPRLPVLLVSGFVGEAGESDGLGGVPILRKPFTVGALAHAVAEALVTDGDSGPIQVAAA